MSSFFKLLKRLATGETVFQQKDNNHNQGKPRGQEVAPTPKTIPQVSIVREDCRINGNRMTCYVHILNNSQQTIYLDDILLLGVKRELQAQLDPGERREFQVYNSRPIKGSFINDCYLLFRNQAGDYFQSVHDVDCDEQPDGSQLIKRIRFIPPVKDV